jgi:hypothetical protein
MIGFNWRSLAATGLLLASCVAFSQATAPDGAVPPVILPTPLQAPPTTYSPWLLALAALALLLLTVAGVKLVMNGLRDSRQRRHRSHRPSRPSNHH